MKFRTPAGGEKKLAFGAYPEVSLKDACAFATIVSRPVPEREVRPANGR